MQNTQISYEIRGSETGPTVVWAHGWGQTGQSFIPLAESLGGARHIVVDFPGFGKSPAPPDNWATGEYADAMAELLRGKGPVLWVGHSFGCRVGLRLAAKYPEMVSGLFLIAAAGLPKKLALHKKLYYKARVKLFKGLKKLIPLGLSQEWLYQTFGSPDYKNAGPMRTILVRVVNEDLTHAAEQVQCPVILAYGTRDTETPVEMGKRYQKLIGNSELLQFEGLDHLSILGEGRHQVAPYLKKFIEKNSQ